MYHRSHRPADSFELKRANRAGYFQRQPSIESPPPAEISEQFVREVFWEQMDSPSPS